jgi:hypothetical protein
VTTSLDAGALMRRRTDRFLECVGGMSDEQWLYRPPSGGWSVSEVTEHVATANRGVLGRLQKGLETPLAGPLGVADDEIPFLFYLGDEPPGVSTPTGEWTDLSAATIEFDARAQGVADFAAQTDLDLRAYGASHPIFGVLDGVQWLLFAGAHTERHRRQLIGYQLLPDFPVS